jgi:hypothetical protein
MAERFPDFQPPNEEQRQNYKYAMLQPFFGVLDPEVVEAMLDLDLFQTDDNGNRIESTYEWNLKVGFVDEKIADTRSPTLRD